MQHQQAHILVVHRRCWAGQVEDLVDLEQQRLDNIMAQQFKVGLVKQVCDVLFGSSEKVVHANDLWWRYAPGVALIAACTHVVSTVDEVFAQMATHKPSTTRHKHAIALHARLCLDGDIPKFGQRVGACGHHAMQTLALLSQWIVWVLMWTRGIHNARRRYNPRPDART